MTLFARVFGLNAAVLIAAAVALVLTPASIDADPRAEQVVALAVGVLVLLAVNLVLLRRMLAPLSRLIGDMRTVDLLVPGRRVPRDGASHELAQLSDAFNDMIDRLERERQASATASFDASESERLRIARELHDQTSQDLTALMLMLERGDRDAARALAEEILSGVRTIITELRPEPLEELGLADALRSLCERAGRTGGVPVACQVPVDLPDVDPAAQVAVYRVAQEALSNAIRHAGATRIVVTFAEGTLTITDDGRGLSGRGGEGLGLRGMRERALTVGATLAVTGAPGGGTAVRMALRPTDPTPAPPAPPASRRGRR
jgi:two-component system sensor histidine kinase UhpB